MNTEATASPFAHLPVSERDRIAHEYRSNGTAWATIAHLLGFANESSARTAANRHRARVGLDHGHVAQRGSSRSPRLRSRRFGVEMEFITAPKFDVARAVGQALGISDCIRTGGIHVAGYHGSRCRLCNARINPIRHWRVESDASVDSRGDCGGEVVPPPLSGESGFDALRKAMGAIRSVGGEVDTRCGMHVHVDCKGLTPSQIAKVVETLYEHHDLMDRLVAPSRRTNHYCTKPHRSDVEYWADYMRTHGQFPSANRTQSINVTAFPKYGTIEIRYHQGTLNARKAIAWVKFLLAVWDSVRTEQSDSLAPGLAMLGTLVDQGRLDQQTAAYLTARVDVLARR